MPSARNPEVSLWIEPTSALDPIATQKVEELMEQLKEKYTIVIVTHSMQQAARISDKTAFFLMGELIEFDDTDKIFTNPKDKRTEDYITGLLWIKIRGENGMKKTKLETDYEVLLQGIEKLSVLTIGAYENTLEALKTLDLEIALQIIKQDQDIDDLQEDITEESTIFIIRQQPVASDLRKILMVMRLATEYERIADYTKNLQNISS